MITFLVNPFNFETDYLKAPLVSDEVTSELEMIDLCEEDKLKPALREGTAEFWENVPMEKYVSIKRAALKVLSMSGSTLHLRVCVFYPKSRKIKASICTD